MIKNIIFFILIALVLIFVVQNIQVVEVQLLAWTVSMPKALMIFVTLVIGIVAGWMVGLPKQRKDIKTQK